MTRRTARAQTALDLYERVILPCFSTQAARAQAIGLTRQALRPWEHAELHTVNERSLTRLQLVAGACERLDATASFSRRDAIGRYLLGSCMLDHPVRRLDLVLTSGSADTAVELARAESHALAQVAIARLPAEALRDQSWEWLPESLSAHGRAEYERLVAQDVGIPAAL